MHAPPDVVDQLASRVALLEERVAALEHRTVQSAVAVPQAPTHSDTVDAPAPAGSGIVSVLGIGLLGIAGAYVLRAVAANALMPMWLVAILGIAYALAWLAAGARAVRRRAFAGVLYAATSILILAPMLWEMFLRFHALNGLACAFTLALYAAAAATLSLRTAQSPVFVTAFLGAALAALALSIATHEAAAFAVLLVAMDALCEYARLRGRSPAMRAVVALAADVAVWMVLFVYRSPATAREDYPALAGWAVLAIGGALLPLSFAAIGGQALWRRRGLTIFDIAQATTAFLLAAVAIEWFIPSWGGTVLGSLCVALSAACYAAAFGPLRHGESRRNFRVFAAWSVGLFLAGVLAGTPPRAAAVLLSMAAVAAMLAGRRMGSRVVRLHAVLYLVVGAALSGVLAYATQCFIGAIPAWPGWVVLLCGACAVGVCAASRGEPGESWQDQFLHLIVLALASFSMAALATRALVAAATIAFTPGPFHIALLRTLSLCAMALALAFAGARWRKLEMTRVAYAAIALAAAKLLFEDLHYGRMEFIAASIFLVAVTLMAVPRLAQWKKAGVRD